MYALGILGIMVAALLVVLARSGKGKLPSELR
jgi:hypothetical protein